MTTIPGAAGTASFNPNIAASKTPEEQLAQAWSYVSAASHLADACRASLAAEISTEGMTDAVRSRLLAVGDCYGVEPCPADDWFDYVNRLGWVLSLIAEPQSAAHGSC